MNKKRDLLESDDEVPAAPKLKAKKEKEVKVEKKKDLPVAEEPEELLSLKVNKDFAKKYQEKKKSEELTRLKEALGPDAPSSDSESEDEDGELLNQDIEDEFYKIIPMIANKDKRIYDVKVKFFEEAEKARDAELEAEAEGVEVKKEDRGKKDKKKKEKALHVSDYLRERLLTKGAEAAENSDDDGAPPVKSFAEEEADLKAEFWKSVNEMEDGKAEEDEIEGDLLKKRKRTKEDTEKEEIDFATWRSVQDKKIKEKPVPELQTLERYWRSANLDANERFLRDYVMNHRWEDKDEDAIPSYEEIVKIDEEDGKELEKAENFEAKYNFRHEEPGATTIPSFPRTIETSMRRTDDSRKLARQAKKARKDEEKLKREEEKKRLKALTRDEITKKLAMVKKVAGESQATAALDASDLEGDFDPEKYDAKMQKLYGDDYYGAEDADEKPVFSDEDEAVLREIAAVKTKEEDDEETDPKVAEAELARLREQLKVKKAEIKKDVEAYYKLDYEDMVGGQPVRFRYIPVQSASYGLSVEDILAMEDKDLNQVVSLKKLAPYRVNFGASAEGGRIGVGEGHDEAKKKKNKPRRRPKPSGTLPTSPAAASVSKERTEKKERHEMPVRKEKKHKHDK